MKDPRSSAILCLFATLALVASGGSPARSDEPVPSFDCKQATTKVEKTICEDTFTGFRDGALGKLYSGLVESLTDRARANLLVEQRNWLKARDRACTKVRDVERATCLNRLYDRRLRRLGVQMRRARLGPGVRGPNAHGPGPVAGVYSDRRKNFSGSITIVEFPKGDAWVEISTVSGRSAHICNLWTGKARREGATLTWRDTEEAKCEVSLTFKGRTVRTKAGRACRYYCGANGYFEDITYRRPRR